MIVPAESIYDGTWQGEIPPEIQDYEMCRAMGWSWRELKDETPAYVQRAFFDIDQIRRENEHRRRG